MTIPIKIMSKKDYLKDNSKPDQEQVWDSIAKPWKKYVVKKIPSVEKFLDKISSENEGKKVKVVDLGCGTGRNMIAYPNIEYVGVDFSENQLDKARDYVKKNKIKARLIKSEINDLRKVGDNTFDHGLFVAALHCIEKEEDRRKALEELYRVLKAGGRAMITTWNSKEARFNHVKNKGDIYMAWRENEIPYMRYYYLYEKEELKKLIRSVGFKITKFVDWEKNEGDRFNKKNWRVFVEK